MLQLLGDEGVLAPLGIPSHAEAVYRTALRRPDLRIPELADLLAVPVEQLRAELGLLEERQLVTVEPDDTVVAARPDVVVQQIVVRQQVELAQQQQRLTAAQSAIPELLENFLTGQQRRQPDVAVEVVRGLGTIRTRIDELLRSARAELLVSTPVVYDDEDAAALAEEQDTELLQRGVRLCTLYPHRLRELPVSWELARRGAAAGEQIRLSDQVPAQMVIQDREVAVLPVDPEDASEGALIVWSRPIVQAMATLFDTVWDAATPAFGTEVTAPAADRHGRLVALLASGAKDETIARQLGLGLRTVRRDVATLLADYGADTRFQAGFLAGRRSVGA